MPVLSASGEVVCICGLGSWGCPRCHGLTVLLATGSERIPVPPTLGAQSIREVEGPEAERVALNLGWTKE